MLRDVYRACFLILIFCGSTFPQGKKNNLLLNSHLSIPGVQQAGIEELTPGQPKVGVAPAHPNPGICIFSGTQYAIQYPGRGAKLVMEVSQPSSLTIAVRRNLPVAFEGGKFVADDGLNFPASRLSFPSSPPLDAATYYIAPINCSPRPINFTLTVNLVEAPDADTVDVPFPSVVSFFDHSYRLELGSTAAPEKNGCSLGRTQYTISVPEGPYCEGPIGWAVDLRGDQNLNLYARLGQRVAVEDGKVVADFASKPPTGDGVFYLWNSYSPAPGVRTYFIAVENCNGGAANYVMRFFAAVGEFPPPSIIQAFLNGKNLEVHGYFLNRSSIVLINGEPQATKYVGNVPAFPFPFGADVLIAKRARNKIAPGETVTITVQTGAGACITHPRQYTRPSD